ncbi:MAG TPA: hypothetical protein VGI19_03630 [Candidatus Cybelea sp.]|jgi:hypothetical protein
MTSVPQPELQFPIVPSPDPTLSANLIGVTYVPGNGAIFLQIAELREAPVEKAGDKPVTAIYEFARFCLTPRALRQLYDTAIAAVKAYEEGEGHPLPTQEAYVVRAVIPGLLTQHVLQDNTPS